MRCPRCLDDNPAGAKFCNGCGAPLELACLACQHANPAGSRLCNECGMEVKTGSHFPAGNQVVFLGRYVEHQVPSGVSAIEIPGIIFPAGLPFGVYTIETALSAALEALPSGKAQEVGA